MPPATRSHRKPSGSTSTPAASNAKGGKSSSKATPKAGEKRSAASLEDNNGSGSTTGKDEDVTTKKEEQDADVEVIGDGDQKEEDASEPPAKKQKTLEDVGVTVEPVQDESKPDDDAEKNGKEQKTEDVEMDDVEVLEEDPAKEEKADGNEKESTDEQRDEPGMKEETQKQEQDRAEAEEKAAQEAEAQAEAPAAKAEEAKGTETESETVQPNAKASTVEVEAVPKEQQELEKGFVKHEDVKEYGQIHFAFRPRVETPHPKSIDDVQRLHIILQPHAQTDPSGKPVLSRLIQVAKKVLPGKGSPTGGAGGRGETFWGYVSEVSENVEDLHGRMKETSQETKTMGTRVTPADRIVATGPYALISQSSSKDPSNPRRSTHLIYTLTAPTEMGEVQEAFNLSKEGSFGMSVKNPEKGSAPGTGLSQPAKFSDELQQKMSTLRWHAVDPPQYMDYVGAEFIFTAHNPHSMTETLEKSNEDHANEIKHEGDDIAEELRHIAEAEAEGHHAHESGKGAGEGVVEWVQNMLKAKGTVEGGAETLINGHWE